MSVRKVTDDAKQVGQDALGSANDPEWRDEEFETLMANERRKGIVIFILWTTLVVAMFAAALLFSYFIPHMLR